MEPHHDTGFPTTLCRWIGEIVQSSPEAARLTLLELIVGAVLASGGHVTQAILALTPRLGWQAYHWMLERGRFRLLGHGTRRRWAWRKLHLGIDARHQRGMVRIETGPASSLMRASVSTSPPSRT